MSNIDSARNLYVQTELFLSRPALLKQFLIENPLRTHFALPAFILFPSVALLSNSLFFPLSFSLFLSLSTLVPRMRLAACNDREREKEGIR